MGLKKIKKLLFTVGAVACLALPMSACGGTESTDDSTATSSQSSIESETSSDVSSEDATSSEETSSEDVSIEESVSSEDTASSEDVSVEESVSSEDTTSSEDSVSSEEAQPIQLEKPMVTLNGKTATWEAISGVTYKYAVDGGEEQVASENRVELKYYQTLTVWAVGDGERTLDSEKATVTRTPVQATPTLAQLQDGYTFDWDNQYTEITKGTLTATGDIQNATAKTTIEGASAGFGNYVMHLTGNDRHDMSGFTRSAGNMKTGYVYTVEVDYYAVSASGDYVIALGNGDQNMTLLSDPFKTGLGKLTFEYEPNSEVLFALTFWTNGANLDVYLGNIKITAKKASVQRTDYHEVTDEELLNGYTYNWAKNNIVSLSNHGKYVALEDIDDATLKTKLENTGAFKNGYALKFAGATGGAYINPLSGKLVDGAEYTVSFTAYEVARGSTTLLLMNSGNAQAGRVDWDIKTNANGTVTYTTKFKAVSTYYHVSMYVISSCELYISEMALSRSEVEDTSKFTEVQITGTKSASDCNTYSQGTLVDTPTAVLGQEGFGDKAYKLAPRDNDKTFDLFSMKNFTVDDPYYKSVTVTVYYYIESVTGAGLYLQMDGSNFQPLSGNKVGYYKETYTFAYAFSNFCIHYQDGNFGTMYIGSVDYAVTTLRDLTDTSLVERDDYKYLTHAEMENGYMYDFSESNALKISANAEYRQISGLPSETLKTALQNTGAFTSGYALKLKGTGGSYIQPLSYNLIDGYTYTITFDAYQVVAGNVCILPMGGMQVGTIHFNITKNTNGTHRYTATFTASIDYLRVNLFIISECELYLANFNVKAVAPTSGHTSVNATEGGVIGDSATVQLRENGYANSNAIVVTPTANTAGVWVNAVGLDKFNVGDTVHLSFRLNPSGDNWYANVKVYDENGKMIDYAYPANGWSYVNYDAKVVDKNGVKCVYIGLHNALGEACLISEAQVDGKTTDLDNLLGGTTITQLANVGFSQMEGYLIKTTDGKVVIMDGGTTSEATALYNLIKANVTADGQGKYVVDAWFLSHYHSDHVGALIEILNTCDDISITTLYYDFDGAKESFDAVEYAYVTNLKSALTIHAGKVGSVVTPKKGDEVVIGNVKMKVLNNAYFGNSNTINNSSVVYKLETSGESVLFLGDLGDYGDTLLNDSYFVEEMKTCTVIQMAHHGQAGTTDKFYRAINDIRICLYPAPAWLYDVDSGSGLGSGPYGTLGTRELMRALGVRYNYTMVGGNVTIG